MNLQSTGKVFNKKEVDSQGVIGENSLGVGNVSKPTTQEILCGGLRLGCG